MNSTNPDTNEAFTQLGTKKDCNAIFYLFSFGYKLKSLLSCNFLSNQTEPMKQITKIQQPQKPMKHPQPNLAPKKRLQWLSKKSNQQNS